MKKVILTGFEPFGGYKYNPTKESTKYFHKIRFVSSVKVIGVVLPCTYYGAYEILSALINEEKPDAIISTGLASSVRGISIETTFRNIMNGKYPDSLGEMPNNQPILDKTYAEKYLMARADSVYLANILHSNEIPVVLSIDAGEFICNSLGYLTTNKIMKSNFLSTKNMFIHIPWTDDYKDRMQIEPSKIFLEKEKYYQAIELLIKNI